MNNYLKIDGSKYKKIYVIGDLHGCYDLLMNKLSKANFDFESDLVISVGDLIDRGEQSLECLRLINIKWFKSVKGNHEQMAINGINGDRYSLYSWLYHYGHWFLKLSLHDKLEAKSLLKLCDKLPLVIELNTNGEKWIIAHADYPYNRYEFGKLINNEQVIWNRERIQNMDRSVISDADYFIFGHTPLNSIAKLGNRYYIDTGEVFTNNLTVKRIDNN